MKKKNGFTLVELLAVIVILGIILLIAVPKIMSVVSSAKESSFSSSAKLIATQAETEYATREALGTLSTSGNPTCADVASYSSADYDTCTLTFASGVATLRLVGKGKFAGYYVCAGTSSTATVQTTAC